MCLCTWPPQLYQPWVKPATSVQFQEGLQLLRRQGLWSTRACEMIDAVGDGHDSRKVRNVFSKEMMRIAGAIITFMMVLNNLDDGRGQLSIHRHPAPNLRMRLMNVLN